MGNGHCELGIANWALQIGKERNSFHAPCPMPHYPLPIPHAPLPIPHYHTTCDRSLTVR
ncbi:MAG: hypothetical protein KME31_20355 [Tolypothrix carrinoi HA7290-LM1]|nr:hypothetical protein [Tolypothrix carrinoi HA7290-LM1]